jgi:hypothetical protein
MNNIKRLIYIINLVVLIILLTNKTAFSQCGCPGGAPTMSLSPILGTTNIGTLEEESLRLTAFYRYNFADEYKYHDIKQSKNLDNNVKSFNSNFMGLLAGYGFTNRLTLELELGYFMNKTQEYLQDWYTMPKKEGSGFSHVGILGKYNVYYDSSAQFEFTAGLGGKAPLRTKALVDEQGIDLPQYVQPSTGAFGLIVHFFLHKGFGESSFHLFLINRSEFNTTNKEDYRYGNSYLTSLFATTKLFENMTGIFEIRDEYRQEDKVKDQFANSGGNVIILSPQLNYNLGDFNISALFDYPVYSYYNAYLKLKPYIYQLAQKYSFAVNLSWQISFKEIPPQWPPY